MDNPRIIHAPINNGRRYGITSPITQYDYGYLLLPEGVELPTTYEIDFSNDEKHGTSFTVYGNSEGAEVPEELIRTGKDVYAFYYKVGEDYGKTEYTWRIPNHCRPIRDGQTPTPSQQSSIDQLIVRSNEAVTSAEQSASNASQSAQSAQGYAEQAETAKSDAQTYANNASASATSASQSATASAQSASQSAQIKSDVEDLVDDARGYASASAQSATASANSASQAQGYAQSASASANSASGYASQADISANTASTKAQDASTSAQTASAKATESAQSASQALTYKTDAESAKVASQTAQGLAEQARDTAVSAKTDAESAKADAESARDEAQQAVASISGALAEKAPVITDTASGSIASFPDGADDIPLKSLVVNIDPVQDGTGDPSPENICPISGWTEVDVNHSGADMTNPTTLTIQLGQTVYGGKLDVLSGELVIDRAMVDLGTLVWAYSGDSLNHRFSAPMPSDYLVPSSASDRANVVCSRYASNPSVVASTSALGISGFQGVGTIFVRDLAYSDVNLFTSAVNGEQLVYRLAIPITIQLTIHQANSLLGVNNIWADSGDCTAEYRADTKLFIERLTAPDSADMIADANITSGQYFMVGNNLFKSTANIANGSAIVVGTNCIRKSLSEALNEINV